MQKKWAARLRLILLLALDGGDCNRCILGFRVDHAAESAETENIKALLS